MPGLAGKAQTTKLLKDRPELQIHVLPPQIVPEEVNRSSLEIIRLAEKYLNEFGHR